MPQQKAQVSLETLLVLAALLAALALVLPRVMHVSEAILAGAQAAGERAELSRLAHVAAEAYFLGNGNTRDVRIPALSGAAVCIGNGTLAATETRSGANATEKGDFAASRATMSIPANARVRISCCTPEGVSFSVSTATP